MPRRPAAEEHTNTSVQNRRKATQRERLVAATITTVNRDGYAGSTVAAVIEEAGVSRPTFYDYFEDRDDGFVATVLDVRGRLLADVRRALEEEEPQDALAGALRANVEFASSNPAAARFLMKESLAGGPGRWTPATPGSARSPKPSRRHSSRSLAISGPPTSPPPR